MVQREQRSDYVPNKGNKGTFQLNVQDKSLEERENHEIPNSKQDRKYTSQGKRLSRDWLRYVRWDNLGGQLHQTE